MLFENPRSVLWCCDVMLKKLKIRTEKLDRLLLLDDSRLLDDAAKRDSDVADAEDTVVIVETFFSPEADSVLTAVDFLLAMLFLEDCSDQLFFASAADSVNATIWSKLSAFILINVACMLLCLNINSLFSPQPVL